MTICFCWTWTGIPETLKELKANQEEEQQLDIGASQNLIGGAIHTDPAELGQGEDLPDHREPDAEDEDLFNPARVNPPHDSSVVAMSCFTNYIAGAMARRLRTRKRSQKTPCSACQDSLVGQLQGTQTETFLQHKQLTNAKVGLTVPSTVLVEAVKKMEQVFNDMQDQLYMDKVKERFLRKLTNSIPDDILICSTGTCLVKKCVVDLFLNIRLHFALRDRTRQIASARKRQNRKMLTFAHL